MATEVTTTDSDKGIAPPSTVKGFMALPSTKKRVEDLLGARSSNFMTSVSTMISSDDKLAMCEPISLFMACLTAAALDLPVSKQLGFAHIIPYQNNKKMPDGTWKQINEAQFQLGWRGYVQLAMRTGQYETIAATAVYEGQLVQEDPLDGNTYDWKARANDEVIGYVAKFKTTNGFKKEVYMSMEEVQKHANRYSKAYAYDVKNKKTASPWSNNFDAMALKTVIKQLISKWGIMSIELEKAVTVDSSVIKEDGTPSYIDGETLDVNASDEKKNDIVAANLPANVDPKTGEIHDDDTQQVVSEPPKPEKPAETVAAKAKRKYGPKQATIVDEPEAVTDDSRSSNNPGQ